MTGIDLPWPSMTFYDLLWPVMTFYDFLWPSMIKCLLTINFLCLTAFLILLLVLDTWQRHMRDPCACHTRDWLITPRSRQIMDSKNFQSVFPHVCGESGSNFYFFKASFFLNTTITCTIWNWVYMCFAYIKLTAEIYKQKQILSLVVKPKSNSKSQILVPNPSPKSKSHI